MRKPFIKSHILPGEFKLEAFFIGLAVRNVRVNVIILAPFTPFNLSTVRSELCLRNGIGKLGIIGAKLYELF